MNHKRTDLTLSKCNDFFLKNCHTQVNFKDKDKDKENFFFKGTFPYSDRAKTMTKVHW